MGSLITPQMQWLETILLITSSFCLWESGQGSAGSLFQGLPELRCNQGVKRNCRPLKAQLGKGPLPRSLGTWLLAGSGSGWALGLRASLPHWLWARAPCHMGIPITRQLAASKQASKKSWRRRRQTERGRKSESKSKSERD